MENMRIYQWACDNCRDRLPILYLPTKFCCGKQMSFVIEKILLGYFNLLEGAKNDSKFSFLTIDFMKSLMHEIEDFISVLRLNVRIR